MYDCPKQYRGYPIKHKWVDAGGKEIYEITYHNGFRLARCPTAYVLLCHIEGCINLSSCSKHNVNHTDIKVSKPPKSIIREIDNFPMSLTSKLPQQIQSWFTRPVVPQRRKEDVVMEFLQSKGVTFIHNKTVLKNGSRCRPDFRIKTKFGYICVEVDEYQHTRGDYTPKTEQDRMIAIYNDIQEIDPRSQVLFIRYNPDKCDTLNQDIKQRLSRLYSVIRHYMKLDSIGVRLGKIYLYYDGFTGDSDVREISTQTWKSYYDGYCNII